MQNIKTKQAPQHLNNRINHVTFQFWRLVVGAVCSKENRRLHSEQLRRARGRTRVARVSVSSLYDHVRMTFICTFHSWFFGKLPRIECERHLGCFDLPIGSFIIRESESSPG